MNKPKKLSKSTALIESIFLSKYKPNLISIPFTRLEMEALNDKSGPNKLKNLGDTVYSFRYRQDLPHSITSKAPEGKEWVIRAAGDAAYKFDLLPVFELKPNPLLEQIRVPDGTPGIIVKYAQSDEQALLAKLRYNRLLDIFLGAACYSLQGHLRTKVDEVGQIEIDELYVAVRKSGAHYIVPVQAKGGSDKLGRTQIEQDYAYSAERYPHLQCRPVGAQFIDDVTIALFEFSVQGDDIKIRNEHHYRLVPPDDVSKEDLERYAQTEEG